METIKSHGNADHFIILIPHRDVLNHIALYREKLFAAGFHGAFSFPPSAPLARVSVPFCRNELRELALNIRSFTRETGGKIRSMGTALVHSQDSFFPIKNKAEVQDDTAMRGKNYSFFGLVLDLSPIEKLFPGTKGNKMQIISPAVLCAALVNAEEKCAKTPFAEEVPSVSFRAASLANLSIRRMDEGETGFSLEWRIGEPVWLPAFKKE